MIIKMGCYKDIKKGLKSITCKEIVDGSPIWECVLLYYIFTISISNLSNENVTRVLEERAKHVRALLFAVTVT